MQGLFEKGWFKLLMAAITAVVLALLLWTVLGKSIGSPCHERLDCFGLSAKCLNVRTASEFVCTRSCETLGDCPRGWTCEGVPMFASRTQEVSVLQICIPPPDVPMMQ